MNQIVLDGMLKQDQHAATFVETGGVALVAVDAAAAAGAPFDVELLDLQLPDMHGIDVLRALRAHPDARLAGLPVVVVSALALDREKQECVLAGADGFVCELVRSSDLRAELRRLWEAGRLQRRPPPPSPPPPPPSPPRRGDKGADDRDEAGGSSGSSSRSSGSGSHGTRSSGSPPEGQ